MTIPTVQSLTLGSNRSDSLPPDTLQVVCFYDGNGACAFEFEYVDVGVGTGVIGVDGIRQFDTEIKTVQYAMHGTRLTGNFTVRGVQANGVVDGLAFGLFWRDVKGCLHIVRSNSAAPTPRACYVGAWPLGGWSAERFMQKVTPGTDGFARETALAVISGAKLLPDGQYNIPVL